MEHFDEQIARTILVDSLAALDIEIDESAQAQLIAYLKMLLEKNEVMNLISPKQDLKTKIIVHLVDSLTPLLWPDLPLDIQAMDFGSGGGLPAIPLAIVLPGWDYTLIESTGKKVAFLQELKEKLPLDTVSVKNTFLEPGKNTEKAFYDLITARGVSDLQKLFAIAGPRLNLGGFFIAFKGPHGEEELDVAEDEMQKQNLDLYDCLNFKLPFLEAERRLFIFEKL